MTEQDARELGRRTAAVQAQIDAIDWYHDFDFGGGLAARSRQPDTGSHRRLWSFIDRCLADVDFGGKDVLDIGCWDGFWSFLAERRGARSVLASDDLTQNWSDGRGIHLARELLGSCIEVRQDVSVYALESLGRQFDVILCLGVYYHLLDPFLAFAQIRHCCRPNAVVVLEGDAWRTGPAEEAALYRVGDARYPTFLPTVPLLAGLLDAAYLRVQRQRWLAPAPAFSVWQVVQRLRGRGSVADRLCLTCVPFRAASPRHPYRPPFGLHVYDPRYQ